MLQIDITQKTWQTQYCHHKASYLSKQSGSDWQAFSAGDGSADVGMADGLISIEVEDDEALHVCVPDGCKDLQLNNRCPLPTQTSLYPPYKTNIVFTFQIITGLAENAKLQKF